MPIQIAPSSLAALLRAWNRQTALQLGLLDPPKPKAEAIPLPYVLEEESDLSLFAELADGAL